jgi:sec-independent protein translocase protein TatB
MFGIGATELVIICVVALLVFGPKRLPELARTLAKGMGEFRRASHDLRQSLSLDDLKNDLRDLGGPGTIHKPQSPPTRPAQAGDDPSLASAAPAATASAESTAEHMTNDEAAPRSHPGELPLGNDHEHHDQPEEEEEASSQTDPPPGARPLAPSSPGPGSVPVSGAGGPEETDPKRG